MLVVVDKILSNLAPPGPLGPPRPPEPEPPPGTTTPPVLPAPPAPPATPPATLPDPCPPDLTCEIERVITLSALTPAPSTAVILTEKFPIAALFVTIIESPSKVTPDGTPST